jgi:hypothetical protein
VWNSAVFSRTWFPRQGRLVVCAIGATRRAFADRVGRQAPPFRDEQLRVVAGNVDDFSDLFVRQVDTVDRLRELPCQVNAHLIGSHTLEQNRHERTIATTFL